MGVFALQDLTSQRFGRLVVIELSHRDKWNHIFWRVRCDCENKTEKIVMADALRTGRTLSCGCLNRMLSAERGRRQFYIHGYAGKDQSRTPEYYIWAAMMQRCYNPNNKRFRYYGACGIKVFDPWHSFEVFLAYLVATIGLRPPGKTKNGRALYSIDRIDNNGNYEPDNIRWATESQQQYNKHTKRAYRGISQVRRKWMARITENNVRRFLGYFDTAEEASVAYEQAARKLHGEFYRR